MEVEAKHEAQIMTLRQAVHLWKYYEQQAGVRRQYYNKS